MNSWFLNTTSVAMATNTIFSIFIIHCCPSFFYCFFCPLSTPMGKHERCRMHYQCEGECVCVWMTYCAPVERPVHHTGLSIWFAPSAIKTGSVYTSGELSFSLCLSVSLDRSQPCLFHTHTYALTRLCHNRERLLVRHLPEYRLTDISHPAVTDDHEEQGQHSLPCPF